METSASAKHLKEENENLRQELHIVKGKLNVTMKTTADLVEELDQLEKKSTREIEQIRTQCDNQLKAHKTMIEYLKAEIEKQNDTANQQNVAVAKVPTVVEEETLLRKEQDWKVEEAKYLEEIDMLKQTLANTKQDYAQAQWKISEQSEELELLKEHVASQKGNLLIKTQENAELRELLEATQEQNSMLSSELAGIRSDSNNANQKGNSLFAEVADQRKTLMNKYTQLKTRFFELKSEHQNCPRQIRELRNMQQRSERLYEECIKLIKAAQSYNVQTLKEQNNDLNQMVDDAKRRIRYLEHQMATESDDWVNKLITYNREEMKKLEIPLRRYLFKQREAMELHEDAVKDGCFWRMEVQRLKMKALNMEVPGDSTFPSKEGSSAPCTKTNEMEIQEKQSKIKEALISVTECVGTSHNEPVQVATCGTILKATVLPTPREELKEVTKEPAEELNMPRTIQLKRFNLNDMIAKYKMNLENSKPNAPDASVDLCTGSTKPNQLSE
ncbi:protein Spindly [Anopheles funestus]|uniref:protein Spindly n=1 Tax=Anopheles funestus TaxID=62324 RepID=UPI0020C6BAA3|nr:protein Spindly [Anopheles funestus]